MLTIGSLFSGIGGLELGLEWAGLGPVKWQCEQDGFCQRVLERHWPSVERFNDVRSVNATNAERVDVICGGFPCQDVSSAGKGAGLAGERSGLWREFARIVGELQPRFVVVENVASGASRWLDTIVCDLEQRGYECLPIPLSASDVGAPHRRKRVFVVGVSNSNGDRVQGPTDNKSTLERGKEARERDADGIRELVLHTECIGWEALPAKGECWSWSAEPDVGRVAHGVPLRVDRLRALGNAVVPQCAEVVGWVVRELALQRG